MPILALNFACFPSVCVSSQTEEIFSFFHRGAGTAWRMFNGSVFYFQCFFSLLHTKAEAKKNLHDLSETSFCSHEPLFRTFPFPHFHRFSMAVISMPMPTVREGEKERKIFLPFFFCCLMQTSFEAGYCVIRISENRYRISRFRAPRGVSVVLSDTSRHCSRTD